MSAAPARHRAVLSLLPSTRARRRLAATVAGALSLLLAITVIPSGSALAAEDDPAAITIQKTIAAPIPSPFTPGQTVNYEIQLQCSNVNGFGCDDAVFTDPVPAPLVLQPGTVSVTGLPTTQYTLTTANNTVRVAFAQPTGMGTFGLIDGQTYNLRFSALLPTTVSGDANGVAIPNTATLTSSNAVIGEVSDTATITPVIPLTLASSVTKSFSPASIVAVPGTAVKIALGAGNTSNRGVDELMLQDPADSTSGSTFDYLAVTGIDSLVMPTGADRVRAEWFNTATGAWVSTGAATAAPANPSSLLPSPMPSTFGGVRFYFSKNGASLPTTVAGAEAKIVLAGSLRADKAPMVTGTVRIGNTASSVTRIGSDVSAISTQTAQLSITKADLGPAVTKQFDASALVPGGTSEATITSHNGDFAITTMVVAEPKPGQATLADQGLRFDGFTAADIEWPVGATRASIVYAYGDALPAAAALTTTTADTLPAPAAGRPVVGFTVTFSGLMAAHEYAALPFGVTALAVSGSADVVSTNIAESTVTTADGQTNSNTASDDLTRTPARVFTTTSKTVLPAEAFAVRGSSALVQLRSAVTPMGGTAGSTVGAEYLSVTDPATPSAAIDPFWDRFDIAKIARTAVPAFSSLSVSYWNGSAWAALPNASNIAGPTTFDYTVPAELRDSIRGVRFTFTPAGSAALLQPGYTVSPNLQFALRPSLRSDAGEPTVDPAATVPLDVVNTVRSEVGNEHASPAVATADANDSIALKPVSGTGLNLVDKFWLGGDPTLLAARSGERATARLSWSTQGVAFDELQLTDPATTTTGALPAVEATSFETFDLVRIEPITTATDPLIAFDRVKSVQLYSASAGDWVNITGLACATAAVCDGAFPGFTLTATQRADTLGVRVVFAESPARESRGSGVLDPAVGSGVAASTAGRPLDLTFELRDYRRSDPTDAVLGSDHPAALYNEPGAGVVRNDVRADGSIGGDVEFTDTASDTATIIDQPVNVIATKSWKYDPLGLPPVGTPASDYPIAEATISASNATEARVDSLSMRDPDNTLENEPKSPYDILDLQDIVSITVPQGATSSRVVLSYLGSTEPGVFTIAQALALTETQLSSVMSISIEHTGRIVSAGSTTAVLAYRLRADDRRTGAPVKLGDTAINTVAGVVADAGGTPLDVNIAHATDTLEVVAPDYSVTSAKTIAPVERFEDDTSKVHTVTLSATPAGTVRTRSIAYTDATPTFFNAYAFTALRPITVVSPVNAVRVDALVGVTYELVGTTLVARCAANVADPLVLDACWKTGVRRDFASAATAITPTLPTGVAAADVRGVRFTFSRAVGSAWERPFNPTQPASFTVTRRTDLLTGGAVPSTLSTLEPAPGETALGTATNTLEVLATGSWGNPDAPGGPTTWIATSSNTKTVKLLHRPNGIRIVKAPFGPVGPGQEIPFTITTTNTGTWPMTGLVIRDTIQADSNGPLLVAPALEPDDPGIYSYTLVNSAGVSLTPPAPTPVVTGNGSQISFAMPAGFVLRPGDVLTIGIRLVTRADLPAGTSVDNFATATSDRVFDTCRFATNTVLDPQTRTLVPDCTTATSVYSLPSAPLRVIKGVKGVGAGVLGASASDPNYDDLGVLAYSGAPNTDYCTDPNAALGSGGLAGYYRTPCIPITRPGATESWKTVYTNTGNIPARTVSSIDVLPAADDRGVIINQARSSRWTPTFTGNVALSFGSYQPQSARILYSTTVPTTVCNRLDILNSVTPGGVTAADVNAAQNPGESTACIADIAARQWLVYDEAMSPTAKAAIKAFKVVLAYRAGEGLLPREEFGMSWNSTTAAFPVRAETADRDSIAWNSVAASSSGYDSNNNLRVTLVTEARKVGVAMATGKLDLSKTVVKPTGFPATPTGYPFKVTCTSLGQNVPLVGVPVGTAAAPDASLVTLASDGTVLHYNDGASSTVNLPLYAECSIAEQPVSQGAAVTVSAPVTALRDYTKRTDIATAAFQTALDPDAIAISAVNDYEFASFTVSKAVTQGAAQDASGTGITRSGPYSLRTVCAFLGVNTTTNFTLSDGDSRQFTGIPAGSTCTLTELGTNGAGNAVTSMSVNGATATTGKATTFTVTRNSGAAADQPTTAVAVRNTYSTGAVTITKAFAGAGAATWGDLDYTARLVCTLVGASPSTVYDGTVTLSKASPSSTVRNLANGAACTVTEPKVGGANAVAIAPSTFTVGTNPATPTAVTVTNTFTVGALRVTKALAGEPAASLAAATGYEYEVSISCERPVDGAMQPFAVPGGATRTIQGAGSVDYTGLPTGAVCVVSETDEGYAQSSALTPANGTATIGSNTTVGVTVTNTFATGSVPVHKAVEGDASDVAPGSFTATVACDWHGSSVTLAGGGEITITDGNTTTIDGVPVGAECTVTESDSGQRLPTLSTPASVTVGSDSTLALNLVNNYDFASLKVAKTVTSSAASVPKNFGFGVRCEFLGATVLDEDFLLDDGEERVFTELPARSTCVVTETDDMNADGTVSGGLSETGSVMLDQAARTVTITELSADTVADVPRNEATFENLYDSAVVTVTKTLHGAGAAQFGIDQRFSAHVVCSFAGQTLKDETVTLDRGNGFTASFGDLVEGSECAITEPALMGADAVVITPNDGVDTETGIVVVPVTGVVNADVANWYLTASLAITKTFAGEGAAAYGTRAYEVQLSCLRDGQPVLLDADGKRVVSKGNPTAEFGALPTGAVCELAELTPGGATWTKIMDPTGEPLADATEGYEFDITTSAEVLSAADQPQTPLEVQNAFELATVAVTKNVETSAVDAAGQPVTYGPFEVALSCELDGVEVVAAESSVRSIADGETLSWTNLPVGADCAVTETDDAGASSTSIAVTQGGVESPEVPNGTVTLAPLAATNTAVITNGFASASVDVRKVVDGSDLGRAIGTYPVALQCRLIDESHPFPGLAVRDLVGEIGGELTLVAADLPAGSECRVTETDAKGADATSTTIDDGTAVTGRSVSFALASGVAAASTITVTNTFGAVELASTGFDSVWLVWLALFGGTLGALMLMISRLRRPRRRP